ncbi:hypothetical protein Syun_008041 [Stephania yunnanensis]|uniref:Uncharacterized protein n=1 Tax=Stephania yunnanensis TaxID=152371 RepID=A0AAP0L257_9MAGN
MVIYISRFSKNFLFKSSLSSLFSFSAFSLLLSVQISPALRRASLTPFASQASASELKSSTRLVSFVSLSLFTEIED